MELQNYLLFKLFKTSKMYRFLMLVFMTCMISISTAGQQIPINKKLLSGHGPQAG